MVDGSEEVEDDELEGGNGEYIVEAVPLEFVEEDCAVVDFADVIEEGGEDTHREDDSFEEAVLGLKCSEDGRKASESGDGGDESHEYGFDEGELSIIGHNYVNYSGR
ncbi:unnamed protein product [Sphagnum balticum]